MATKSKLNRFSTNSLKSDALTDMNLSEQIVDIGNFHFCLKNATKKFSVN